MCSAKVSMPSFRPSIAGGNSLYTIILLCPTIFLIKPFSSRSLMAARASEPLIFNLSTRTATVMRR